MMGFIKQKIDFMPSFDILEEFKQKLQKMLSTKKQEVLEIYKKINEKIKSIIMSGYSKYE